ncbi:serine/threonine-protein kinase [Sorangium sp. So ce367]|uniref:serine/threonine protein kinase n=1 Tax=Sorangium sp. So ce367 TaxID=3133305 RepID=UPI003F5FE2F4
MAGTIAARALTPAPPEVQPSGSGVARTVPGAPVLINLSTTGMPAAGDDVGEQYKLERSIGEGSFGKVYRAHRKDFPSHVVALKIVALDAYKKRDARRELSMLTSVNHPHVVQLKDHGVESNYVWFTMPFYSGKTLEQMLRERDSLSLREAYEIFLPIARGLNALHAVGIRHQDIKPENIFIAEFGGQKHPIVLDLGAATEKAGRFVACSPIFAAPEQIDALQGKRGAAQRLSEKTDSYSFGTTLLCALIGTKAYFGEDSESTELNWKDVVAMVTGVMEDRERNPLPTKIRGLWGPTRAKFTGALKRWLHQDPMKRASMDEIIKELEILVEPEKTKAFWMKFGAAALAAAVPVAGIVGYFIMQKNTTIDVQSEQIANQSMRLVEQSKDHDECKSRAKEAAKQYVEALDTKDLQLSKEKTDCARDKGLCANEIDSCEWGKNVCIKERLACNANYSKCAVDLATYKPFEAKYNTCDADLQRSKPFEAKYNTCDADLQRSKPFEAKYNTCDADLQRSKPFEAKYNTCDADLQRSKPFEAKYNTCDADLQRSKPFEAKYNTCDAELKKCQQAPPSSPPPPPAPPTPAAAPT